MEEISRDDVIQRGRTVWTLNVISTVCAVVVALIPIKAAAGAALALTISLAALAVSVVAGFWYLGYLGRAATALTENMCKSKYETGRGGTGCARFSAVGGPRSGLCPQECGPQGAHILLAGGMEIAGSHHIRFRRDGPPPADGAVRPASAGGAPPARRLAREGAGPHRGPAAEGGRGLCGCWAPTSSPTGNCWRPGACGRWTRCPFSGSTPGSWPWRPCSGRASRPKGGTVALRGRRVDRDMVAGGGVSLPPGAGAGRLGPAGGRGALRLAAPGVRHAGCGPDGEGIIAAVRFDETAPRRRRTGAVPVWGHAPAGGGVSPGGDLEEGDREDLPLLAALWETGRLEAFGLEFT